MNEQIKCPICGLDAKKEIIECKTNRIKCPVCKTFNIGDIFDIPSLTEDEKVKLRYYYYILDERDKNRLFSLTSDNKEKFLSKIISPNTLIDKIDNLIKYLADKTKFYGEPVLIPRLHGYRLFFCRDEKELQHILQEIKKLGYISENSNKVSTLECCDDNQKYPDRKIIITYKGLQYAKTLFNRLNSTQCFVAMWFDSSTQLLYEKIKNAVTGKPNVERNSPEYGANYNIMKIDEKEHVNYIPSEIISEIKRSKFMIADLTGYRGGVYYEAGFAEGLGIPVILTCKKDWLEDIRDNNKQIIRNGVLFDLKQKNILQWEEDKLDEFQRKLVSRIGEIVGFN